jgi:membrane protease YdiL (CAAX protease family)
MFRLATPRQLHLVLIAAVVLWYLGTSLLPLAVGSCLGASCEASPARIVISILIPLGMALFPVLLEVSLFGRSWSGALQLVGLTRVHGGGFGVTLLYLIPLALFFPVFAALTGQSLALQPNTLGLVGGALLNNGINEETMMRGFVFRNLRERGSFWPAAAVSTAYFAACHLPLLFTAGPMVGGISILIAVPTGFLLAYVYERGARTVWAAALAHAGTNLPPFIFAVGPPPVASSLYMLTSIVLATAIVVAARRAGYQRG